MLIVASNEHHTLLSFDDATTLYDKGLSPVSKYSIPCKKGALQYKTGIAALCFTSRVVVYDFLHSKELYTLDTYKRIHQIALLKNILICISAERILIHDLSARTNLCYIPVFGGQLAFVCPDYYQLHIAYQTESTQLCIRSIWLNTVTRLEGIKYQQGCFSFDGTSFCLALQNLLTIYRGATAVKIYGLERKILFLIRLKQYYCVQIDDGTLVLSNQEEQFVCDKPQPAQIPGVENKARPEEGEDGDSVIYEGIFDGQGPEGECIFQIKRGELRRYDVKSKIPYKQYEDDLARRKAERQIAEKEGLIY